MAPKKALKRPAAAVLEEEPADEPEVEEAQPPAKTMKRPAAAVVEEEPAEEPRKKMMKRPAAAKEAAAEEGEEDEVEEGEGDEEDDGEEGEEKGKAAPVNPERQTAFEARDAKREMDRKKRSVDKLYAEKAALAAKVKANNAALKSAEAELDELEAVAKKKGRALSLVKAKKQAVINEKKAERMLRTQKAAAHALKVAKQRLDSKAGALDALKTKQEDARFVLNRAKAKVAELEKKCAELRAKGMEVPEEGDESRDFSAPGAWKPPGVMAAKTLTIARAELVKAEANFERAALAFSTSEAKAQDVRSKIEAVRRKRREATEQLADLPQAAKGKGKAKAKGKARK